jgi:hypothetical protein
VQFRRDEIEPLLQTVALGPGGQSQARLRVMVRDILQYRRVLGQQFASSARRTGTCLSGLIV